MQRICGEKTFNYFDLFHAWINFQEGSQEELWQFNEPRQKKTLPLVF